MDAVRRFFVVAGLLVVGALALLPAGALAMTTISQGYITGDQVTQGSIVSLQKNSTDHVTATTSANVGGLLGVVIDDGSSLLTLTNGKESQIQVATSGVIQVLVSDINGPVNQGDQITASPISGVGMKATSSVKVIGIAQDSLAGNNSSKESYKDKAGAKHDVNIGQIPVLINVSYFYKQPEKTLIPSAIQNVANSIAGRKVDSLPIIISLAIFIVTMIVIVSIIYTMIRSSIISVGRNPMSQSAIYRNLMQMSILVLVILGVATAAIYWVLAKF